MASTIRRYQRKTWAVALLLLASAPASAEEQPYSYDCEDLVIVGRITWLKMDQWIPEGDFFAQDYTDMKLRVSRRINGKEDRKLLKAKAFNARFTRGRTYVMTLLPTEDGHYVLHEARPWNTKTPPKIAARCNAD